MDRVGNEEADKLANEGETMHLQSEQITSDNSDILVDGIILPSRARKWLPKRMPQAKTDCHWTSWKPLEGIARAWW